MKLAECGAKIWDEGPTRKGCGVVFECPLCVKAGLSSERRALLPVPFKNPIDGGPPTRKAPLWDRTGDSVETLTLSPSVNADSGKHDGHLGWHGYIRHGEIVGGGA